VASTDKIRSAYFILFWLTLNLFQAYTTTLTSDEGYYWLYSQQLEWGYYDHPPMLALLIRLGYELCANELGVRLMGILLNSFSLLFFFELLPKKEISLHVAYGLLLSLPLLNYITFIVFPDTALLAFALFFLYSYKQFLEKGDWLSALGIGLATVMLLYAKYHAVLLVGFTVLSNLKLLKHPKFYLAMLMAFVLFLPHLYWQYSYDFPSFKYHLSGRASTISFKHVPGYVIQQLVAVGPGFVFIPFIIKTKNQFEKTLQFIAIGTLGFFLIASFRGMVHFHWTSIAIYPILLLAAPFYTKKENRKWLYRLVLPFLFLILILRAYLSFRIFPVNNLNVDYYHGRELWAEDIAQIAEDDLVLFENNLREAPLYVFYSGKPGISLYPGEWKKSQYEIWNYEDQIQGKAVLLIKPKPFSNSTRLDTRMGKTIFYLKQANYTSYQNIRLELNNWQLNAKEDSLSLNLEILNHRSTPLSFEQDVYGHSHRLYCKIEVEENAYFFYKTLSPENAILPNSTGVVEIKIPSTIWQGKTGEVLFGFDDQKFEPSVNSIRYPLYQIFSSAK
jgi:hypothetical protein